MKKILILLSIIFGLTLVGCKDVSTSSTSSDSTSQSIATTSSSETTSNSETTSSDETTQSTDSTGTTTISELTEFDLVFLSEEITISPYKDIDAMDFINPFNGAVYEFTGVYEYLNRGKVKSSDITFDGSMFNVPKNDCVAIISVKATYEGTEIKKDLSVSVLGTLDVIDAGFGDLWKEDTITVTSNFDPQYIKSEQSSLKYDFSGYFARAGIQFACLCGHMSNDDGKGSYDVNYLSIYEEEDVAKAFEDAYIVLWVYNNNKEQEAGIDDALYFGVRFKESENFSNIDLDWGQTNILKAERGKWTLLYWSLKDWGKTTDLLKDIENFYSKTISNEDYRKTYDAVNFKVLGYNCGKTTTGNWDTEKKYSFSFYCDGYDIVSKAQFDEMFDGANKAEIFGKK